MLRYIYLVLLIMIGCSSPTKSPDPPTVENLNIITNENTPVLFNLVGTESKDLPLTFFIASQPTNGIIEIFGSAVTYTPNINYFGSDSFTYSASSENGDSNIGTVSILINPVTTSSFSMNNFTSGTEYYSPHRVQFTNTSKNGDSYLWNFGDGNTSTEENPSHTFNNDGNWTITLDVFGPNNNDSSSQSLNVLQLPLSNTVYTSPKYILNNEVNEFNVKVNAIGLASAEIEFSIPSGISITSAELPTVPLLSDGSINPLLIVEDKSNEGKYRILTSALAESALNSNGEGDLVKITFLNNNNISAELNMSISLLDKDGNLLDSSAVLNLNLINEEN